MRHPKIQKLALSALFCALVFVATQLAIPAPAVGNVNLGDGMLLLCAQILGGPWAMVAAAVGAALTDLLSAYAVYAPATLVIKACMVAVFLWIAALLSRCRLPKMAARLIAALCAELVMMAGYFLYECLLYGPITAALNIPFNAVQGTVAIALFGVIYPILSKIGLLRRLENDRFHH